MQFDVFKVPCALCEEGKATTSGFARAERSSKILQGTIVLNELELILLVPICLHVC